MQTCQRHLSKLFVSDAEHLKSKNTCLPEEMETCLHSATILSILAHTNTLIWAKFAEIERKAAWDVWPRWTATYALISDLCDLMVKTEQNACDDWDLV